MLPALADDAAEPRSDYLMHCSGCHMPDGSGLDSLIPTLHGVPGRLAATAAGRNYLVRVPGVAQAPVSDETLASIINWMLREFSAETLPDDFEPLSVEEVATARSESLSDPMKLRAQLFPDES